MTDSLDRRTPSGGVPSLPSSRADGVRILRAGVFFGPFPLTARLNPREGAPRGLLTSVPGTPFVARGGGRILRAGVFFGPFPLTARLNPREGAPRGLLTSMPGTGRRPPADRTGEHARRPPRGTYGLLTTARPLGNPPGGREPRVRDPRPTADDLLPSGAGSVSLASLAPRRRGGTVKRHQCPRLVGLGATPLYWESFGFGRRGAPGAGSRHHAHCSSALILLKPPAPTYYAPSDHQTPPLRRATPTDGRVATETETDGEETIATTVRPHVLSTLSDRRFGETPGPARARAQTSGTLRRGGPPNLASGGRFDLPRAGGSYSKRLFVGEPTPPLHQFLSFRGPDRPGNGGPKTPSERGRSASTVPRNRGGHGTPWVGARSAPARPRPYRPSRRGEGGTGSFAPRRRSLSSKIPEPSHGGAGAPPRTALHDRFTWSGAETPDRISLFSRDGTVPAIERTTNPPPPADRPFYGDHTGEGGSPPIERTTNRLLPIARPCGNERVKDKHGGQLSRPLVGQTRRRYATPPGRGRFKVPPRDRAGTTPREPGRRGAF